MLEYQLDIDYVIVNNVIIITRRSSILTMNILNKNIFAVFFISFNIFVIVFVIFILTIIVLLLIPSRFLLQVLGALSAIQEPF